MILEEGVVVAVRPDRVLVHPDRSDRCEGCSTDYCVPDASGELIIEANDPIGVKVGQRIRLSIRERVLVGYSLLLYGVPLLGLLTGAFGGTFLAGRLGWDEAAEGVGVLAGVGLTIGSFLIIRRIIQRNETPGAYRPEVVEILGGPTLEGPTPPTRGTVTD